MLKFTKFGHKFKFDKSDKNLEGWFSAKYPHKLVVESLENTEKRLNWDKNIASSTFVERIAKNAFV
jgi:hypothetical protein